MRASPLSAKVFGAGKESPKGFNALATAFSCPGNRATDAIGPRSTSASVVSAMVSGFTPARAVLAISSGTKFLPLFVEEHRIADLAQHVDLPQPVNHADALTDPRAAILQEAKRKILAEQRRPAHRGDIAFRILSRQVQPRHEQMRARGDAFVAERPQTHQLLTLGPHQARTGSSGLADAVFLGRNHLLHADVKGGDAAMNLGMGDKALLDPQHVQRLHPVGATAHGMEALNVLRI